MKHDERIKVRFDELTISRYDLVSGEALFIDEQITFSFRQKWFSSFNMFFVVLTNLSLL